MGIQEVLAALADENRRKILLKLKEGKISSGELAEAVGMTPQALSYHLSKLKKADLIYETRFKNFIYYELNLSILDEAIVWMSELRGDVTRESEENHSLYPHAPAAGGDSGGPCPFCRSRSPPIMISTVRSTGGEANTRP